MSKEETFVSLLQAVNVDVFPLTKPDGNNYCVVYKLISSPPLRSHSGTIFEKSRYQFDCYAQSLSECKTLAGLVKTTLTMNGDDFALSYPANEFYDKDQETMLFRSIVEFYIW